MKLENTRGFYSVEGPDGEEIILDGVVEVSEDTGEYLQANYSGFTVVEAPSLDENPQGSTVENTDTEPDEYVCGVNGCSRTVDSPEATCWQHE